MRILIVEDDFTSRRILQKYLFPFGECDLAEDGKVAVNAFSRAWAEERAYDLICLDIMLPGMNGQEVLKEIRSFEEEMGIYGLKGVKVIMTTALDDFKTIMKAFKDQCESYLVKPIEKARLMEEMNKLGLFADTRAS